MARTAKNKSKKQPAVAAAAGEPAGAITVFFATNRRRLLDGFDKDSEASPDGAKQVLLGSVSVEALGDPDETTEASRELLAQPETTGIDDFADPLAGSSAKVLDLWLNAAAQEKAVPLVFLHGFANSFNSAVARAAQLKEFYAAAGARILPLAFCWPSDGILVDIHALQRAVASAIEHYRADQVDAGAAGVAFAKLIRGIQLARDRQPDGLKPCLLAHSMGNHTLNAGLGVFANGMMTRGATGLFEHAFLMAADVPHTALGQGLALRTVAALANQVTLGISYDSTLRIPSEIANGNRRLGHAGPETLDGLPSNLTVVDYYRGLEPIGSGTRKDRLIASVPGGGTSYDTIDHQYYRNDRYVRGDIAQVLNGKKPADRVLLDASQQVVSGRTRHMELRYRP